MDGPLGSCASQRSLLQEVLYIYLGWQLKLWKQCLCILRQFRDCIFNLIWLCFVARQKCCTSTRRSEAIDWRKMLSCWMWLARKRKIGQFSNSGWRDLVCSTSLVDDDLMTVSFASSFSCLLYVGQSYPPAFNPDKTPYGFHILPLGMLIIILLLVPSLSSCIRCPSTNSIRVQKTKLYCQIKNWS